MDHRTLRICRLSAFYFKSMSAIQPELLLNAGRASELRGKNHSSLGCCLFRLAARFQRALDFKVQMGSDLACDEWGGRPGRPCHSPVGHVHCRRECMSTRKLCLAAALVILAAVHSTAPAQACKARPHSASLCSVVSASADIRDEPDGRVEYSTTGKVRLPATPRMGCGHVSRCLASDI